ncbi:hypothetical protein [Guptibacillus hwajinpoensis]|uniref:hypothetical protein n=1 Tax=Guptibacillus hwajinpoensis TaxID=208199 RepID=UPI00384F3489
MYYFLYRTDYITEDSQIQLLQSVQHLIGDDEHSYFINRMRHYLQIQYRNDLFSLTITNHQVLICTPHDFETGCDFTDFIINFILHHLGAVYTLIEP